MAQKSVAQLVRDRWEASDRELAPQRRHHQLNEAFYEGQQWVWWNGASSVVELLPGTDTDDERLRVTINKIAPRVRSLLGRMVSRNLTWDPAPSAADDATLHGARRSRRIVAALADEDEWEGIREAEVLSAFLGGTSAVMIEWDNHEVPVDQDERTGRIRQVSGVKLSALSITEFGLEPGSRTQRDARWFVTLQAIPPEQAQAHYKLDKLPAADGQSIARRRFTSDSTERRVPDLTCVYTMYERPNFLCPKGRHVVVIGDKAVVDREWPFERTDHLNLWVFPQDERSSVWYGKTFLTEARPVQVAYNMIRSNIHEHARKVGNARMLVPQASMNLIDEMTDDPGEIIPYLNEHGKPEYMIPPTLARWLTQEPQQLEAELDDIMHSHAVARGQLDLQRQSGISVSILAEKNDTPLGLMAREQAKGWGFIGSWALDMLAQTSEERTTVTKVGDYAHEEKWNGAMLRGQTKVTVPLESTLPQSRSAMQAMLGSLNQMVPGILNGVNLSTFARILDLPDQDLLVQALDADAQLATRENYRMSAGEACVPEPHHDHARHFAEHNVYRNSDDFIFADDEVKRLFDLHLAVHQHYMNEEVQRAAGLNQVRPGLAAVPQSDEPVGSAIPVPSQEMGPPPQTGAA